MERKHITRVVLAILAAGAALGAWWFLREGQPPITYLTAPVERGAISQLVTATGTVNPVTTVQVGTYVSGPIKALFVDFNSPVRRGQRVAQIDPRPFVMKVKQAEANVATARAQVEKDKADLNFKQQVLKRARELFERALIAKQEVEAAERDYEQALAQLQLDQARLAQNLAALEEARVNLGYTDIVSPVDGVVVSRNVNVGQTVAASFQTPVLFEIAQDLTKMQVNTNVSESDIGGVKEGQSAFFTVDAYPERQFWGRVVQVRNAPQTVQNVVTYDVVVSVENPDLALKPGMTANMSIITAHREDVLKVPLAALRFRPSSRQENGEQPRWPVELHRLPAAPGDEGTGSQPGQQVWVYKGDNKLQPVQVQVGLRDDTYGELLAGDLREGEQVVTGMRTAEKDGAPQPSIPGFGPGFGRRMRR
ncbi:MAG: efflux RND transporter periplasmic adaptor subunit [Candidatus Binatia bacterium]|nr:efflux RND transporter periplasmic adaptor subunit [Candidatus Binatia bacterium]